MFKYEEEIEICEEEAKLNVQFHRPTYVKPTIEYHDDDHHRWPSIFSIFCKLYK